MQVLDRACVVDALLLQLRKALLVPLPPSLLGGQLARGAFLLSLAQFAAQEIAKHIHQNAVLAAQRLSLVFRHNVAPVYVNVKPILVAEHLESKLGQLLVRELHTAMHIESSKTQRNHVVFERHGIPVSPAFARNGQLDVLHQTAVVLLLLAPALLRARKQRVQAMQRLLFFLARHVNDGKREREREITRDEMFLLSISSFVGTVTATPARVVLALNGLYFIIVALIILRDVLRCIFLPRVCGAGNYIRRTATLLGEFTLTCIFVWVLQFLSDNHLGVVAWTLVFSHYVIQLLPLMNVRKYG